MKKILKSTTLLVLGSLLFVIFLTSCRGSDDVGEVYDDLIGRWRSPSLPPIIFNLYEDGTGARGGEPFTWGVSDGYLNIMESGQTRSEQWSFSVDTTNYQLTINNQQQADHNIDFYKVGDVYPALTGIWAWNGDPLWNYSFNEYGGGRRGIEGNMETFEWGVIDGQLRFFVTMTSGVTDSWHMTINDVELRLENVLDANQVFYYTRTFVD